MSLLTKYVKSSRELVEEARRVAEELRHDAALHRLAMQAVFVLEDCHEALLRACCGPDAEFDRIVDRHTGGCG